MNGALIDQSFKLFNDKKYEEASASFGKLLSDEETPAWVKNRVQTYKRVVDRALSGPQPDEPSAALVSYYMNLRDYPKAEEVLETSGLSDPDKAFYRAQMRIEQGDREAAIASLKIALDNNDNRGYAINSPSFGPFLKDEDFLFLQIHE